jgi:hypothetical protein
VKRAAAIACAGCVAAVAQTAVAAPITLLSPNSSGPPPPPLTGGQQLTSEPGEVRVPGTLKNEEAVRIGLGADGRPVSVVVTQRMSIRGLGDFRFVVPAPATNVAAIGGSQSMPGLRQAGIVWQGFSPGKRLLAARITLSAAAAASGLPLRISVERGHGVTRVRLDNATSKQFNVTTGSASVPALQRALAQIRLQLGLQLAKGRPLPLVPVQVEGTVSKLAVVSVDTPIHVTGTMTVAGAHPAKVDTTLGGGRQDARTVQLRGAGKLTIALTVSFAHDRRSLLPTASALAASADPLRLLEVGIARGAVALQYQQYLASPKPDAASSTSYSFRTVRIASLPTPHRTGGGGGVDLLVIALGVVGGIATLGGLTVLWAHL